MARHRLTNAQWELIKDVFPSPATPRRIKDRVGHPRFGLSRMGRKFFAEPELDSRTLDMTCAEYRSTRPTTRRAKILLGWVEGQSLVGTGHQSASDRLN